MTPADSDIIRQGDHTLTSNDTIRQWYYQARRSHIDLKWHHQAVILSGKEITHWPQMTPADSDIIRQGDHTLTSNDTNRQWYYQARRSHIDLKWHHQTVILSGKEITHWPQMTPSGTDIIRQGDHTLTSKGTIRQWYYQTRRDHTLTSNDTIRQWYYQARRSHIGLKWHHQTVILSGKEITHWPQMTPSDSDIIRQGDHTLTSNNTNRQWYYQARRSHIDLKWHHQTVILSGKEITHWPQVTPSDSNIIRQGDITHWPEMTPSDSDIIRQGDHTLTSNDTIKQ